MKKFYKIHSIVLLFCLLIASLFSTLLISNNLTNIAKKYNEVSLYKTTEYDYILKNPSAKQVSEFKKNDNITAIVPSYNYMLTSSDSTFIYLEVFDKSDDLDFTPFNKKRIIESSKIDCANPLGIDWRLSYKKNLKIGDKIKLKLNSEVDSVEFQITTIYESYNNYTKGVAVCLLNDSIQKMLTENGSEELKYTAAYLTAKDIAKCWKDLDSYQPLGRKKTRSEFFSDLEYQEYLDFFNSMDFKSEIVNMEEDYKSINKDNKNSYSGEIFNIAIYMLLDVILSIVLLFILNRFALKTKVEEEKLKGIEIKKYNKYNILFSLVLLILNVTAYFLGTFLTLQKGIFYKNTIFIYLSLAIILLGLIMFGSAYLVNNFLLKGKKK